MGGSGVEGCNELAFLLNAVSRPDKAIPELEGCLWRRASASERGRLIPFSKLLVRGRSYTSFLPICPICEGSYPVVPLFIAMMFAAKRLGFTELGRRDFETGNDVLCADDSWRMTQRSRLGLLCDVVDA
jgi:hypothetical protein